eukprot:g1554.t1
MIAHIRELQQRRNEEQKNEAGCAELLSHAEKLENVLARARQIRSSQNQNDSSHRKKNHKEKSENLKSKQHREPKKYPSAWNRIPKLQRDLVLSRQKTLTSQRRKRRTLTEKKDSNAVDNSHHHHYHHRRSLRHHHSIMRINKIIYFIENYCTKGELAFDTRDEMCVFFHWQLFQQFLRSCSLLLDSDESANTTDQEGKERDNDSHDSSSDSHNVTMINPMAKDHIPLPERLHRQREIFLESLEQGSRKMNLQTKQTLSHQYDEREEEEEEIREKKLIEQFRCEKGTLLQQVHNLAQNVSDALLELRLSILRSNPPELTKSFETRVLQCQHEFMKACRTWENRMVLYQVQRDNHIDESLRQELVQLAFPLLRNRNISHQFRLKLFQTVHSIFLHEGTRIGRIDAANYTRE